MLFLGILTILGLKDSFFSAGVFVENFLVSSPFTCGRKQLTQNGPQFHEFISLFRIRLRNPKILLTPLQYFCCNIIFICDPWF
jgi:hypothetical protein